MTAPDYRPPDYDIPGCKCPAHEYAAECLCMCPHLGPEEDAEDLWAGTDYEMEMHP